MNSVALPVPENQRKATTRSLALWIFIFFQAIFLLSSSGRVRIADEQELFFQTQSLVERGELAVPQAAKLGLFFGKKGKNGKAYAPYGPGTAFFAIPHYLAGKALVSVYGVPDNTPARFYVLSTITTLATSTLGALTVTLFFLIVWEMTGSRWRAWRWALAFGLGSYFWSYATCFYGEAMTTLCFTAFCYCFLPGASRLRQRLGLLAYLAAILCKAPLVIYAPALGFWAVFQGRSQSPMPTLFQVAGITILGGLVHMGWNYARFGDAFEFGYNWSETIRGEPKAFGNSFFTGFFGLTISPGKGLLIFAPFTALSLFRARNMYKESRGSALSLLGLTLTGLVFYSNYVFWAGGYCVGPRHLLPILPFFALPALCRRGEGEIERPARRVKYAFLALAIVFQALLVQVSFLEDQAISRNHRDSAYYSWDNDAVGIPHNQYRLTYCPALTYPPRFWRGLTEVAGASELQPPGFGLDHWYLFLYKIHGVQSKGDSPSSTPMGWISIVLTLTAFLLILSGIKIKYALKEAENVKIEDPEETTAS
ncbi:MAG: hypothetical protein P1V97_04180 [Planctomycetota bacterium]|nr:hypothetical protein [Planctomycetota bacterium]